MSEWLITALVWTGGAIGVCILWALTRGAEKERAGWCVSMANELLERASLARREAMLCDNAEQRDRYVAHASLLTREADYWRDRAKHWEAGDI